MNSFNSIHVVDTIDHKHLLQIHLSQLILEYLSRPKKLEYKYLCQVYIFTGRTHLTHTLRQMWALNTS